MKWALLCLTLWIVLIGLTYRDGLAHLGDRVASDVKDVVVIAAATPGAEAGEPRKSAKHIPEDDGGTAAPFR